eukprot:UN29717
MERSEKGNMDNDEEEAEMRQNNIEFLLCDRNERAVVREVANEDCNCGKACVGNYLYRIGVIVAFVLFLLGAANGGTDAWLLDWLQAWGFWFLYHPLIFLIYYCREEPYVYTEDDQEDLPSVAYIEAPSHEQVTEWVNDWVGEQCCYGECEFVIKEVKSSMTKRLEVSSFQEARWKAQREEAFDPNADYSNYGAEPGDWEMTPQMGEYWVESSTEMPVPNTNNIVTCRDCNGSGQITSTDDEGNETSRRCNDCNGTGKKRQYKVLCTRYGCRCKQMTLDVSSCPLFLVAAAEGQQKDCMEVDLTYTREPTGGELAAACEDEHFKPSLEKFCNFFLEISKNTSCRIDRQKFCVTEIPIHEV